MSKCASLIVLLLLVYALFWSGAQKAVSQQDDTPKQTLDIHHPNSGISLSIGIPLYTGLVYFKDYSVSPVPV